MTKSKHPHYYKDSSQYDTIDVYAVCKIFGIEDPTGCLHHAIKKLLVTGNRGHKDRRTDIQNAIDTLVRLLELEDMDYKSITVHPTWRHKVTNIEYKVVDENKSTVALVKLGDIPSSKTRQIIPIAELITNYIRTY